MPVTPLIAAFSGVVAQLPDERLGYRLHEPARSVLRRRTLVFASEEVTLMVEWGQVEVEDEQSVKHGIWGEK